MQRVFVIDKNQQPLMPCHPARARELLKKGRAAVFRRYPFTIILKDREGGQVQDTQFKVDPGAKTSGIALVADFKRGVRCIWAAELHHRGWKIRDALLKRRQLRRGRRGRKTRYRPPRFDNRRRPAGWLAPSLKSRVDNVLTWFKRLIAFAPITHTAMELVRFDTHKLQNPEINGVEYQQGELYGYEVREYLLEKWGRKCAYCGAENVPLEVEHINPKRRGGSDRVSNLTIACVPCNREKGSQTAAEFGHPDIQAKARRPLRDTAAVNSTRWALFRQLRAIGLPLETGTGGRTKYNRSKQGYPKTHWLDAVCVGESGYSVFAGDAMRPLQITAIGRGKRQMCQTDKFGFPKSRARGTKRNYGFQTGDIVRAAIPSGKYAGTHTGRITIRANPSFALNGFNVHPKYLILLQRGDGFKYEYLA